MKRGSLKVSEVSLPDEIISKILTLLPVKPLLRFRCVSKWWNSLIGGEDFVKEHLECSRKAQMNKKLIFNRGLFLYCGKVVQEGDHVDIEAEVLEYPNVNINSEYMPIEIKGSCRGLVLLSSEESVCMLWNPFTRTNHVLPNPTNLFEEKECFFQSVFGLGYDEVHDDYKVVRVVPLLRLSYVMPEVEVYDNAVVVFSLKSNSWTRVSDFPHFVTSESSVFVNGALHYVVFYKKGDLEENPTESGFMIASFDIRDETYRLVPQPDYKKQHFTLGVGELGGDLCMIRQYDYLRLNQVWVMKEYGVGESWMELFRIGMNHDPINSLRLITYLDSQNQVLVRKGQQVCCVNLKKKSSEPVEIFGTRLYDDEELDLDEVDNVRVCTESLVLLDKLDTVFYETDDETEQTLEHNQENSE